MKKNMDEKKTEGEKIAPLTIKKTRVPKIEKLRQATPSKQFKGNLLDFQREGLDFLIKSSGNALLADEMGLGKTVQTLAYLSKEKINLED